VQQKQREQTKLVCAVIAPCFDLTFAAFGVDSWQLGNSNLDRAVHNKAMVFSYSIKPILNSRAIIDVMPQAAPRRCCRCDSI